MVLIILSILSLDSFDFELPGNENVIRMMSNAFDNSLLQTQF